MKRKHLKPVQLKDVPLHERYSAARKLAREVDPDQAVDLLMAALCPSDRVYYVVEDAA